MPKFSLNAGDTTNHVFGPVTPARGDQLLVVERELTDPTTGQTVGTLFRHVTYMKILGPDDALLLGIAEHHLVEGVIPTVKDGVISVQGSFRILEEHLVFSIVGGTGAYRNARGTVTLDQVGQDKFNYDVT